MNRDALIEITKKYLNKHKATMLSPQSMTDIEERTIRYYETEGVLEKPQKTGRENVYTEQHVKQLVAIKLLQNRGASLALIRSKIKNTNALLEEYGTEHGISSDGLSKFIEINSNETSSSVREQTVSLPQTVQKQPTTIMEEKKMTVSTKANRTASNNYVAINVVNPDDFALIADKLKIGMKYVFLSELDDDTGKKLYRLMNGQKNKDKGILTKTIIPVDKDLIELPGCTATGSEANRDMAILVPDKDVYKEGTDVAQVFVFDPTSSGETRKITVSLSGVLLDTLAVKLDSNGCGIVRVPTMVAGHYIVAIDQSIITAEFEVSRYTLAPLTATLTNFNKKGDKLFCQISALSFGEPFTGPARIEITNMEETFDVIFLEGLATVSFEPKGDLALSLKIFSKSDPDLIANVPLPGSSKEQREETIISSLGKVRSVSLIASEGAKEERALYLTEGAISNSPVQLDSCVSDKIELTFAADMEQLTVSVVEPVLGVNNIYELGSVKKGKGYKLNFDSPFASIHMGAFVNEKPWEGHSIVIKPSRAEISIKTPKQLKPGELLTIKLQAKKKSSVLLRIADQRMRIQNSAKTSAASMIKRWINKALEHTMTGEVTRTQSYWYDSKNPWAYSNNARGFNILRSAVSKEIATPRRGEVPDADFVGINATYFSQPQFYSPVGQQAEPQALYAMSLKATHDIDIGFTGPTGVSGFSGQMGYSGFSGDFGVAIAQKREVKTREMDVDLIYYGLVEVDKEKTIKINLPDSIAIYDIAAFAVCDGDWKEVTQELTVEKEQYLEPMIPQFAFPEDEVECVAIGVKPKHNKYVIRVNGQKVEMKKTHEGTNDRLVWKAIPGLHEVIMEDKEGNEVDKIMRVVECPGEETVLTQELRILKVGETYNLEDDGALKARIVPGMDKELKAAIHICANFEHCCCEQTSAKIIAACVGIVTFDNENEKEVAYQAVIKGEARLKSMYIKGKGFKSYPESSIVPEWSAGAALRVSHLDMMEGVIVPSEVKTAIDSLIAMGRDVLKQHNVTYAFMEDVFYRSHTSLEQNVINSVLNTLTNQASYYYANKSEACFCVANLCRENRIDEAIKVANVVSRAMGSSMGGSMHGSCELVAYLHMIQALQKAGVIANAGASKVEVNGKEQSIEKAIQETKVNTVKAIKGACALKITRLSKIRFDDMNAEVPITVDVTDRNGSHTFKSGSKVNLKVTLNNGYRDGDVLCVALPECLNRIISGTKTKKFQIDFSGRKEISVELVAGRNTKKPQRWAAVVRNMYDSARLGSVGLMTTNVNK